MTRMKKSIIISTLLSATMLMSFSSPAYAAGSYISNDEVESANRATEKMPRSNRTDLKRENVYFNVYDAQTHQPIATHVYGGYLLGTGDYRKNTGYSEAHVIFPIYSGYAYGHPFSPQMYYDGAAQVEYDLYLTKVGSSNKNQTQPSKNTQSNTQASNSGNNIAQNWRNYTKWHVNHVDSPISYQQWVGKGTEGIEAQYLKEHPSEMERCKRDDPQLIRTLIKDGLLTEADVNKSQPTDKKKEDKNSANKDDKQNKNNAKSNNKKNAEPNQTTSHKSLPIGSIITTTIALLVAIALIIKGISMLHGSKRKYKHMR
ncbi:hypothetical protein HMPREF0548_0547 [Lactobacillus ultunensis DSM 16047]|uniref:LPXTG-motif cell wall anchor domain protein n=2 Tax=Lactobacillus ultunensis TaxID=227945 RepID=C2ELK1_9LACO|nr:hypothetical protein HMPREF0548_0547 [Lactobacillus ultunensis DSM 16047]